MLLLTMKAPVGVPVAVQAYGSQVEDGLSPFHRPAHPRLFHPVFDQMSAGPFHHTSANRPALRQVVVVVHEGLVATVIANRSFQRLSLALRTGWCTGLGL